MKYITNLFAPSMLRQLTPLSGPVRIGSYEIEKLKELKEGYRTCIRNDSIEYTLSEKLGMNLEKYFIDSVFLLPGDYLILVRPDKILRDKKNISEILSDEFHIDVYYVMDLDDNEKLKEIEEALWNK